jgi:predicted phage tail protein
MTGRAAVRQVVPGLSTSVAFGLFGVVLLLIGARWWMPATIAGPVSAGGRLGAVLAIGGAPLFAWDGLRVCLTCIGVVPRW